MFYFFICLDSLQEFADDICDSVDISTIQPHLIKRGLINKTDHEYFLNSLHTPTDKRSKLIFLIISLPESCVEKFLDCLSQTSHDYAPHGSLLEKIRDGMSLADLM